MGLNTNGRKSQKCTDIVSGEYRIDKIFGRALRVKATISKHCYILAFFL